MTTYGVITYSALHFSYQSTDNLNTRKYWLTVVSNEHAQWGVAGSYMQACHGKEAPLKRMKQGDGVVFYSSKERMGDESKLQAFTAIGEVADDVVYQFAMSEQFVPYRRNINFLRCKAVSILPLINRLTFIPDKRSWGYPFRFGFLEIGEEDFKLISAQMLVKE